MKKSKLTLLIMLVVLMGISCSKESKNNQEKKDTTENLQKPSPLRDEADLVSLADKAVLYWEGKAIAKSHNGSLNFRTANLYVNESDGIYGGSFVVDMKSLSVLDLTGDDKLTLEGHLKGTIEGKEDHFFDISTYPTAKLDIVHAERLNEYAYLIIANLQLKDVTREIKFNAKYDFNEENEIHYFVTQEINVDRTKFGIKFMSSNFFDGLGDKAINDEVSFRFVMDN